MNFFQRIAAFFTSKRAETLESELLAAALPVAETAAAALATSNPAIAVVVSIFEPVINTEAKKLGQ